MIYDEEIKKSPINKEQKSLKQHLIKLKPEINVSLTKIILFIEILIANI